MAKIFWMAFFFLEKKKKFLMTFFLEKNIFLKKFWAIFSGMALTELHLEICGAHGSLSQKGCRPLLYSFNLRVNNRIEGQQRPICPG